ncbi:3-deoxy-D-arabino-heptulosonate 7-phosphate synthase [Citrifermentans bemidjiense Bem]|uniref:Phospho-2-dehydro-3-deoxyheptonate aldolase n=1 Tax=Citrifermentans bemidjiense (strain ATCC BAA-1014 / DSM 16622 / JCM 12645 / Bem) TaxID=404380 RepID=B5EHS8_CITBB|nr:3-deoxy-7-phosphoheptulonate synthase class II [Citrifermentans bemidjiense]ACH39727.1 3-deoxy-D-arabino-heptulosonate 7-phosphate synthase [Citrifermentans bemidjiense Bem]
MPSQKWTKSSWRSFRALQQPVWPAGSALEETQKTLSQLPPLVFAGECQTLKAQLADAVEGRAFVLQCGDCAEDFSRCTGPDIRELLKVILQMSVVLAFAGEKRVIKIGRIAGQYAKPRSSDTEMVNGTELPSYRGDMVNSPDANLEARTPDPRRMLEGYYRAAATLNLVRSFTLGGYASLERVQAWHRASLDALPAGQKYEDLVRQIWKTINFMTAIGLDPQHTPQLNQVTLYTSHEALLLDYEEALTRMDSTSGGWYDCSAHMLWIGDRTRQLDGAHVEFLRGVRNPLGMKVGPSYDIDTVKALAQRLNPDNEPGRLTLITRFGADKIDSYLPKLLKEMKQEGFKVVWSCDPMHGNTYQNEYGQKSRKFEDILREIKNFYQIHKAEGTVAGGVHLELTGDHVTECTGGSRQLLDKHLHLNYQTNCDPRLNAEQSVELAFELAEMLHPCK